MGELNLDALKYGNARREHIELLNTTNYLDKVFTDLTQYAFPANSSNTAKDELNSVRECIDELSQEEKIQKRFYDYDEGVVIMFLKYLVSKGATKDEAESLINALNYDVLPIIFKLKYYFNRVRPYQLAFYYKLKLFPFTSYSDGSPSYPSAHAVQAYLFAMVIGDKYPQLYQHVTKFAQDIAISRIYMGLHYQSDVDFAYIVAQKIYDEKEFKLKYKL